MPYRVFEPFHRGNGELRHPVVLYELIGLGIILTILILLRRRNIHKGLVFTTYMGLYAAQRLFLDIYRIESTDPIYLGLTPSQYIATGLVVLSISMLIVLLLEAVQSSVIQGSLIREEGLKEDFNSASLINLIMLNFKA